MVMVNQVGGNDSLVFDGSSLVLNSAGEVIAQGKSFEEDLVYFDSDRLTGELHQQMKAKKPARTPRWCWARATTFASAALSE